MLMVNIRDEVCDLFDEDMLNSLACINISLMIKNFIDPITRMTTFDTLYLSKLTNEIYALANLQGVISKLSLSSTDLLEI